MLSKLLVSPHQLEFGVPKDMEAAVHAARIYLEHLRPGNAMLKLDFSNAFNSLSRLAVQDLAPQLLPLVMGLHPLFSLEIQLLNHAKVCSRMSPPILSYSWFTSE